MRVRSKLCLLLLLAAAAAAAQTRDALPVPDLPGYKTLKCDFHLHTVFSDGEVWPTTRVREAWREGLDAIAITDHAGYNPHEKDLPSDLARPYELARAGAEELGILLIPGVEVAEGDTHCNALFVTDPNAFKKLALKDALRTARAQDAFVFWNHPGWKETPTWIPLIASVYDEKLLQGVELVNGDTFYPEAFPWIGEKRLAIFADSDLHAPSSADYNQRARPVTLVFARTADAAGVREALFARRTAAWMGGEVWGDEQYLNGLWRGSLQPENPELKFGPGVRQAALRIRNRSAIPFRVHLTQAPAWLRIAPVEIRPDSIAPLRLEISRNAPAGLHALELEFEVTNFHTAPQSNLAARLPVRVEVIR